MIERGARRNEITVREKRHRQLRRGKHLSVEGATDVGSQLFVGEFLAFEAPPLRLVRRMKR